MFFFGICGGDAFLEDERVGNHGAGDAAGLRVFAFEPLVFGEILGCGVFAELESIEDFVGQRIDAGELQHGDGFVNTLAQVFGAFFEGAFGDVD